MKYVSAYLMAALSGKESPSSSDVEAILESVGGEVDGTVLGAFMKSVEGKTIHELITKGMEKLQAVPTGGGGGGGPSPVVSGEGTGVAKAEEKEEPEEEEEEEDDMGFSLFD